MRVRMTKGVTQDVEPCNNVMQADLQRMRIDAFLGACGCRCIATRQHKPGHYEESLPSLDPRPLPTMYACPPTCKRPH